MLPRLLPRSSFLGLIKPHQRPKPLNLSSRTIRHASTTNPNTTTYTSRLHRLNSKLPPRLQHYTKPLLSAPLSHITSFLILHEITAIVPLVALAALFHYSNWLPEALVNGEWVQTGIRKWGRYFERKGWVDSSTASGIEPVLAPQEASGATKQEQVDVDDVKSRGSGWKVVVEVATAWAVVKALLPVRIVGCVWATPWFARVVLLPLGRVVGRFAGRG